MCENEFKKNQIVIVFELVLQVTSQAFKSKRNRNFNLNNFSMSNNKSEISNKTTGIDIIQKSNIIFSKGTLPRTISNNQSKMQNRPKCRNVSKTKLADVQFWERHSIPTYRFTIEMWGPGQKFRPGRVPAHEVKKTAIFRRDHTYQGIPSCPLA